MNSRKPKPAKFQRVGECLYRYGSNGKYYAVVRHQGKLIQRSLKTKDKAQAKRNLADFRTKLGRVDVKSGRITLAVLCDDYFGSLSQAPKTIAEKERIVERIKRDWPAPGRAECQIKDIRPTDVRKWLASYSFGEAAYNAYLWFIRAAFDYAVDNGLLADNPAIGIKAKKRQKPIRETPSFDQFQNIVAEIRGQIKNARAEQGGDLVEFMGLAGVGNAEAAGLTWKHVDFDAGKITLFRQKTKQGYQVPLYPQVKSMLERMRGDGARSPAEKIFKTKNAKKALKAACERLGYHGYDHRSLRRMFVTRALQKGVDVKTVAEWQGHQDGGRLILSTYSHVMREHSDKMAELMAVED